MKITFGAEYEFGDIDRSAKLPDGLKWNTKDYSLVNSTGVANDPRGLLYTRGGEINAEPSESISELVDNFSKLVSEHPEASVNHRTSLHLHVGFSDLDLENLKRLFVYSEENKENWWAKVDPLLELGTCCPAEAKHRKWRKKSHQHSIPSKFVPIIEQSNTLDEFLRGHAPVSRHGKPAWGFATRAGFNFLQLKETGTIEFRFFKASLNPEHLLAALNWVDSFINSKVDDFDYSRIHTVEPEFDVDMQKGYDFTNFEKHSRKVVTEKIEKLSNLIDIYSCSASELSTVIEDLS